MTFALVEGKRFHCGQMSRALRASHREIIMGLGFNVHAAILSRFKESTFCKAWLIDGKMGAFGGVAGPLLASSGLVWLSFTDEALRYRVAIVKESRRQLALLSETKASLVTFVLPGDVDSERFAEFLGFQRVAVRDNMVEMVFSRKAA